MRNLNNLRNNPWPEIKSGKEDKPAIMVDGAIYSVNDLGGETLKGDIAYVIGSNAKTIEKICANLNPVSIQFYEMRVDDLSVLDSFDRLESLSIKWNTKVTDIEALSKHQGLKDLILDDTPKVCSLEPISKLKNLLHFEFGGGIWNNNSLDNLSPISELNALESLILNSIRVKDGSLRPIAKCQNLKYLEVCNRFKTEEYAYLAAHLPNTECDMFKAYVELHHSFGSDNIMVVGSRKPFLNPDKDKDRIKKYDDKFAALVNEYSLNK